MAALQAKLLARAAKWVKPGGTLLYATCSLEPAEGEFQLAGFLAANSGFAIEAIRAEELPETVAPLANGTLRTRPGMLADKGGLDGFFIARLKRAST